MVGAEIFFSGRHSVPVIHLGDRIVTYKLRQSLYILREGANMAVKYAEMKYTKEMRLFLS
jgi:hypothetical protein